MSKVAALSRLTHYSMALIIHCLINQLLYIFRQLGDAGQQAGASLLLCHLTNTAKKDCVLHIANTGLCEAILCRDGEIIPLASPHAANTNKEECQRIIELGGFITKVAN